jgi:hypothetical protein
MADPQVLNEWVKRNEERASASRQLQKIVQEHPDLLEELLRLYRAAPSRPAAPIVGRRARIVGSSRGTAFERIARLFLENGNEWLDTSCLVKQSGVVRNVAATVMWSVHKDDFEQRPHSTHKRMKLWRLTPQAFDRLKQQNRLFDGGPVKEGA